MGLRGLGLNWLITCIGLAAAYTGLTPALLGKRVKSRVRIELIVDNYAPSWIVHATDTAIVAATLQTVGPGLSITVLILVIPVLHSCQQASKSKSSLNILDLGTPSGTCSFARPCRRSGNRSSPSIWGLDLFVANSAVLVIKPHLLMSVSLLAVQL